METIKKWMIGVLIGLVISRFAIWYDNQHAQTDASPKTETVMILDHSLMEKMA